MDYYSGEPDYNDYDSNDNYNDSNGFKSFLSNNSFYLLIGLAVIIVILTILMFTTSKSSSKNYNNKDTNSYLSSLTVSGGNMSPSFKSDNFRYTIEAYSDYVSFSCQAASSKAKIEQCDDTIKVDKDKVTHNIKVTAEDGNITRYYFTITKKTNEEE